MKKPGPLPINALFCDLHLDSEGVDCFFFPESSAVEKIHTPVCRVNQVHGRDLLCVRPDLIQDLSGPHFLQYSYDGMVTTDQNLFLTVYSADCLPFLFFEPEKRVIAAVHAGWKGTLLEICGCMVKKMVQEFYCEPSRIRVVSGPSIHACCFEIREDVASLFCLKDPAWEEWIIRTDGKMKLNLHEINRLQLIHQGISPDHIELSNQCTCCHPDRLPSFRREGAGGRRMISGIGLRHDNKV